MNSGSVGRSDPARQVEREVVGLFVRIASLIGLPRSVGELYGCLYMAFEPLPMDDLMKRLSLSKGATSQGLKLLKSVGAVRTVYVEGDRRDHFVAERELRKLVAGFLKEEVIPHIQSGEERLKGIRALLAGVDGDLRAPMEERIERLANWHGRSERLIPFALRLIER
jgi:DNA-binding transcriptional regulator GbsR (MarR family)